MSKEVQELPKDKGYKTWVYWNEDGTIHSKIVNAVEAKELHDTKGARLSPAEFHPELSEDPHFKVMASDVSNKMNIMANLDVITDKEPLIELGEFLGVKLTKRNSLKQMKFKLNKAKDEL